jgi:hypothetical protein
MTRTEFLSSSCNRAKVDSGQEALVNENLVNENFAVDVAEPNPNLIKG